MAALFVVAVAGDAAIAGALEAIEERERADLRRVIGLRAEVHAEASEDRGLPARTVVRSV
jgi:hypothetical protein